MCQRMSMRKKKSSSYENIHKMELAISKYYLVCTFMYFGISSFQKNTSFSCIFFSVDFLIRWLKYCCNKYVRHHNRIIDQMFVFSFAEKSGFVLIRKIPLVHTNVSGVNVWGFASIFSPPPPDHSIFYQYIAQQMVFKCADVHTFIIKLLNILIIYVLIY